MDASLFCGRYGGVGALDGGFSASHIKINPDNECLFEIRIVRQDSDESTAIWYFNAQMRF
jgi:uncharacterized protein YneR